MTSGARNKIRHALIAYLHDLAMAALAFVIALRLRLGEGTWDWLQIGAVQQAFWIYLAVAAVVFRLTGLYRGIWRYASLDDLVAILRAVTLTLLSFLAITFLITRLELLPRSTLVIVWLVLIFLLAAPRLLYRVLKDRGLRYILSRGPAGVPVLLVGPGDAAEAFIREMGRDRSASYDVLGIVDDKGTRVGRRIHGIEVIGTVDELPRLLDEVERRDRPVQRLILTRRLERETMGEVFALAEQKGLTLDRLPRPTEFRSGEHAVAEAIRPVAIEDLLGRPRTVLAQAETRRLIEGKRVLVTGAGGSIGGELSRQIAGHGPAEILLADASEYALYSIDLELAERFPDLPRRALLADVRDRALVRRLLADLRPEIVFHAAALKHVPLVEDNPLEGLKTNVIGTRNVAEAAKKAGVETFVLISTDKAIHPVNVMGASKRLAESFIQALDLAGQGAGSGTRFVTLRFGNVLGSTGSVVPLFQRQIAAGGPVTVTHPEMRRYFMTIREAVELVLEAAGLSAAGQAGEAGKIFVLDMGQPVKIEDLARQMIRLSGLRPGKDIEIAHTGLRPGERLTEDLFHEDEALVATSHPGLKLAAPRPVDLAFLERGLEELEAALAAGDKEAALTRLARLVPDYDPARGEAPHRQTDASHPNTGQPNTG